MRRWCLSGRCVRMFGCNWFNFGEPFGIFRRASVMLSKGIFAVFDLFPNFGFVLEGFVLASFLESSGFGLSIENLFRFFLFFFFGGEGNSYLFWFSKNRLLDNRFLLCHCVNQSSTLKHHCQTCLSKIFLQHSGDFVATLLFVTGLFLSIPKSL